MIGSRSTTRVAAAVVVASAALVFGAVAPAGAATSVDYGVSNRGYFFGATVDVAYKGTGPALIREYNRSLVGDGGSWGRTATIGDHDRPVLGVTVKRSSIGVALTCKITRAGRPPFSRILFFPAVPAGARPITQYC